MGAGVIFLPEMMAGYRTFLEEQGLLPKEEVVALEEDMCGSIMPGPPLTESGPGRCTERHTAIGRVTHLDEINGLRWVDPLPGRTHGGTLQLDRRGADRLTGYLPDIEEDKKGVMP